MNLRVIKTVVYVLAVLIVLAFIGVIYGVYLKVSGLSTDDSAGDTASQGTVTGAPAPLSGGLRVNTLTLPRGCTAVTLIEGAGETLLQFTGPDCAASYRVDASGADWLPNTAPAAAPVLDSPSVPSE